MKYVFIINPLAGKGRGKVIGDSIPSICEECNLDYVIHYTKESGDATLIARLYKNEEVVIFSVGGDGTLNEVVNGIVGTKNKLGIIPAGSGNDFYKTLKGYDDEELIIDVGQINDKYFINETGMGIDSEIGINATKMKKMYIPSSQVYNASIVYTFIKFKRKMVKFTIKDDLHQDMYSIVTICNGRYYGGGFSIAPKASINDGYLDVYYVDKLSKIKMLLLMLKLIKGTHEESKHVHKIQTDEITIESKDDLIFDYDGELLKSKAIKIKLLKGAINIYNNKELVKKLLNG